MRPSPFTLGRRAALATLLGVLLFAPAAQAARGVVGHIDFPGAKLNPFSLPGGAAGEVNDIQDVAVNAGGAGGAAPGDVYVADRANRRIQQFSAAGDFVRAWGLNVVAGGPDNADETQSVRVSATSGTFTLSFGGETTGPALDFDADPSIVQSELN